MFLEIGVIENVLQKYLCMSLVLVKLMWVYSFTEDELVFKNIQKRC